MTPRTKHGSVVRALGSPSVPSLSHMSRILLRVRHCQSATLARLLSTSRSPTSQTRCSSHIHIHIRSPRRAAAAATIATTTTAALQSQLRLWPCLSVGSRSTGLGPAPSGLTPCRTGFDGFRMSPAGTVVRVSGGGGATGTGTGSGAGTDSSGVVNGRQPIAPLHPTSSSALHPIKSPSFSSPPSTLNRTISLTAAATSLLLRSARQGLLLPASSRLRTSRSAFSTSAAAMVATKLDGTAIAKSIRQRLGEEIAEKQKLNPRYKPCLKIIQGAFSIHSLSAQLGCAFLLRCHRIFLLTLCLVGDRSDSSSS